MPLGGCLDAEEAVVVQLVLFGVGRVVAVLLDDEDKDAMVPLWSFVPSSFMLLQFLLPAVAYSVAAGQNGVVVTPSRSVALMGGFFLLLRRGLDAKKGIL